MAFLGSNGRFMGVDEEGDIVCQSKTAGAAEFVQVELPCCCLYELYKISCNRYN